MSYEGYSQFLCSKGHYWTKDCYEFGWLEPKDYPKCPICGEPHIWENMVDLTNGSFLEDTNERIDGFVELKIKKKNVIKCPSCGREHLCECTEYEIPKRKKK